MAAECGGKLEDFEEATRVLVPTEDSEAPPLHWGWRKRLVGVAFLLTAAAVTVGTWRGIWKPHRTRMGGDPEVKQDVQALSGMVWGYTTQGLGTLGRAVNRGQALALRQGEMTAKALKKVHAATTGEVTKLPQKMKFPVPTKDNITTKEEEDSEDEDKDLALPLPEMDEGWIYPGNIRHAVSNIKSAKKCARICEKEPVCVAWTWGWGRSMPWTDVCYIRGRFPKQVLSKIKDEGFISGMPTHVGRSITVREPLPGQSLFCFSLIIPGSYELGLMQFQYDKETNIFACDEYATYSNNAFKVAPGVETIKVDSDLKCKKGGEFGTALNNQIFFKVWDVVFKGTRYRAHDWTVKADTDAVFFAQRLRNLVAYHTEYAGGTYLNNCAMGLHGPLEVLSKLAVETWRAGRDANCVPYFNQKCSGDCQWGEDMYIDQCLQLLRVYRIDDFNQLIEDHCSPPPNWQTCQTDNKAVAAFHPFKDVWSYKTCMANALAP